MFADARTVPDGATIDADVCIVGAGVAGITIARALESPGRRIALLESGFAEVDPETQSLYDGESVGVAYFPLGDARTRTRQFGGTSNRWNGECRPLGALDFETRRWVADSGWPFDHEHLRPYYDRAQAVCELGPYAYEAVDAPTPRRYEWLRGAGSIDAAVIQYSPPTRFGPLSRDAFARSAGTTVYLGANVVDLVATDSGRGIDRVDVAAITGHRFSVRAHAYVLATGGIENARLLLAADSVHRHGIGNAHDLVGRYFMEHLYLDNAAAVTAGPRFRAAVAADRQVHGRRLRVVLTLSDDAQRSEQVSGATFVIGGGTAPGAFERPARTAARLTIAAARRHPLPVKQIHEQVPNRASRVLLSEARDALGMRRAVLDWQVSASDKRAAARSHAILDAALRGAGVGRVVESRVDAGPDWPAGLRGHGTTWGRPACTRTPREAWSTPTAASTVSPTSTSPGARCSRRRARPTRR